MTTHRFEAVLGAAVGDRPVEGAKRPEARARRIAQAVAAARA
jgi:hypothetical protein